jgi:signal peptide peptidase SppA
MKLLRKNEGYWLGTEDSFLNSIHSGRKMAPVSIKDIHSLRLPSPTTPSAFHDDGDREEEDSIYIGHMVSVANGIGTIKIAGTLVNEYSPANRYWGDVSYDEVAAAAYAMAADESVKAVILDIDSPGGDANGIERGSSALAALGIAKPVYTFCGAMMCSAAYWLGAEGKQIWATSLSTVGSIGVVAIHRSFEKAYEKEGIAVTVLRQGQYKMLLNPFEDITPEAKSMMEGQMAIIYSMFLGHVSDKRGISVAELASGAGQGQTFLGVQAVKEKLVDQVGDYQKLVNQLRSRYASQGSGLPGVYNANERGLPMKIFDRGGKQFALNARGQAAVMAGLSEDDAGKNEEFLEPYVAPKAGEEEVPAAGGEEEVPAGEEEVPAAGGEEEVPAAPAPAAADVSAIIQMSEKLSASAAENAKLKMAVETLTAENDTMKASNSSLKRVAMVAINRMEVAMSMAPSKQEDFDNDQTVLAKFNRLESDFNGRYKPGAKAEHSSDNQQRKVTASGADTRIDQSAKTLTSLG